ncbi:MAG: hypothetical protein EXS05_22910 [Planctomycetaceae bacterium]|nr:hypothetical protein [Planctomycetaceae bacterium]
MNRLRSWIRVVLPHDAALAVSIAIYLLMDFVFGGLRIDDEGRDVVFRVSGLFLPIAACLYGGYRVYLLHPIFQNSYREWLSRTPWSGRLPLPLGPVHLVTQDAVLMLCLTALALWRHPPVAFGFDPLSIPLVFLMTYEASVAVSLALAKEKTAAYLAAFGIGLMLRLWSMHLVEWSLLTGAAVYAALRYGLHRSFAQFANWNSPTLYQRLTGSAAPTSTMTRAPTDALGWPYDQLRPVPPHVGIASRDGLILSLLTGWRVYVVGASFESLGGQFNRPTGEEFAVLACCVIVVATVVRLGRYCAGYLPPLMLRGRLAMGRLIIPQYDKVTVASLVALGIFALAIALERHLLIAPAALYPIATTGAMLVLLGGGPSLRDWRLTGGHRLAPGIHYSEGRLWKRL